MPRALLFVALVFLACGDDLEGQGTLLLSWSFLDGRSCADSGVEQIMVREQGEADALMQSFCSSGHGNKQVKLTLEAGEHMLEIQGVSAQTTALYSGRLTVQIEVGVETSGSVPMAFVGGR